MKNIDNYINNIPMELKEKEQWLLFKKVSRANTGDVSKTSKIPYSAITLSSKGWNEKENSTGFDKALSVLVNHDFDGLAFVLTEDDPYVCIDLDDCIDCEGRLSILAKSVIKTFEGSYMELSSSKKGIHVFLKGDIESNLNSQSKGIEIYKSNRCIAMTGDINNDLFRASKEVVEFEKEIQKLYSCYAPKKEKITQQHKLTNTEGVPDIQTIIETMCRFNSTAKSYFEGSFLSGDWSRDDFNFLLFLRSFTHGNSALMEDIFLKSALSRVGNKGKRKSDESYLKYLRATIQKVNRVGNNDFWKYNFRKLTQREASI